ncbi:TetR/AcrR family transcriptional regulator [Emcibacter sp. SYSU 3D8]|uniref:TetR/AcrR family transcriptional regulator n=1 Tax=Emcibacter sp. SYSU 3D8 TaxID=3133969 RepID=UPI0031FE50A2
MAGEPGTGGLTARNLGRPEGATAEETRKRLLQAAATLFARNGLQGTTLGEIAGAAGLTAPAIYNHFSSKDDLFIAAVCSMFDEIAAAIDETVSAPGGWLAQVTAVLGMIHELYREDMVLQRLGHSALLECARDPDRFGAIRAARAHIDAPFQRIIGDAVNAGELPADTDATVAGAVLASLVMSGIASYTLLHPSLADFDGAVDAFRILVVDGQRKPLRLVGQG